MDAEQQQKWDQWCDARVETRVVQLRDSLADALGATMKEFDAKIAQVRDVPPPLIAPPDRRLASALQKVGEELPGPNLAPGLTIA
jgi:hypothetical protein